MEVATIPLFIVLLVVLAIGAIVILAVVMASTRKRKASAPLVTPISTEPASPKANKRCLKCDSVYTDSSLNYCLIDGSTLIDSRPFNPAAGSVEPAPTVKYDADLPKGLT